MADITTTAQEATVPTIIEDPDEIARITAPRSTITEALIAGKVIAYPKGKSVGSGFGRHLLRCGLRQRTRVEGEWLYVWAEPI